jgi:hypothetical protein
MHLNKLERTSLILHYCRVANLNLITQKKTSYALSKHILCPHTNSRKKIQLSKPLGRTTDLLIQLVWPLCRLPQLEYQKYIVRAYFQIWKHTTKVQLNKRCIRTSRTGTAILVIIMRKSWKKPSAVQPVCLL